MKYRCRCGATGGNKETLQTPQGWLWLHLFGGPVGGTRYCSLACLIADKPDQLRLPA